MNADSIEARWADVPAWTDAEIPALPEEEVIPVEVATGAYLSGIRQADKIVFELVETNYLTRWRCHICGGCTEKEPILCEVKSGEYKGTRVCESCLKCGHFDDHIRAQIESLERYAESLKSMLGRIQAPTFEQWQDAISEYEQRWRKDHADEIREVEEMAAARADDDPNCPF